jgi:ubiquinone/menaquinone biosynthesis C-methylase UbiE
LSDECADVVIAHTLMSHVTEADACLRDMARLVRKGGTVAIFDGDYASLTFAYPDAELGRRMDKALADATYHNPLIMRSLVRLLPEAGLEITETLADVVAEIGSASFFKSYAETYAPFVARNGLLPEPEVERWLATQHVAMADGTFFASCNYYTYLARRA